MKKLIFPLMVLCWALLLTGCDNYETYADMKAKERTAISNYIAREGIEVISEATFNAQGQTTDTARNQYVLLNRTGVYMQIVRKGCGAELEENKSVTLLCRFTERNILTDSVLISNDRTFYLFNRTTGETIDASQYIDKMSVKRTGTTITASYIEGMMYNYHGSTSVPAGWLVPLNYVRVGRPETVDDETAYVRLIVPHSQGTSDASSSVYPCYYEITYERER
jgi:hypothetical protein